MYLKSVCHRYYYLGGGSDLAHLRDYCLHVARVIVERREEGSAQGHLLFYLPLRHCCHIRYMYSCMVYVPATATVLRYIIFTHALIGQPWLLLSLLFTRFAQYKALQTHARMLGTEYYILSSRPVLSLLHTSKRACWLGDLCLPYAGIISHACLVPTCSRCAATKRGYEGNWAVPGQLTRRNCSR